MSYYKDQIQYEITWKVECEKNKILTRVPEELCIIDDCGINLEKENEQLKQKLEALKELVGEAINERMITEASSYNDWSERETAWTKRAAELLGQTND